MSPVNIRSFLRIAILMICVGLVLLALCCAERVAQEREWDELRRSGLTICFVSMPVTWTFTLWISLICVAVGIRLLVLYCRLRRVGVGQVLPSESLVVVGGPKLLSASSPSGRPNGTFYKSPG
jgi:hypothetical protein